MPAPILIEIKEEKFTEDDDTLSCTLNKKVGNRWEDIRNICFNNTRIINHINNCYYSVDYKKCIAKEHGHSWALEKSIFSREENKLLCVTHEELGNKWTQIMNKHLRAVEMTSN